MDASGCATRPTGRLGAAEPLRLHIQVHSNGSGWLVACVRGFFFASPRFLSPTLQSRASPSDVRSVAWSLYVPAPPSLRGGLRHHDPKPVGEPLSGEWINHHHSCHGGRTVVVWAISGRPLGYVASHSLRAWSTRASCMAIVIRRCDHCKSDQHQVHPATSWRNCLVLDRIRYGLAVNVECSQSQSTDTQCVIIASQNRGKFSKTFGE